MNVRVPKIIAINRFYSPDHSATAQLLTDLAEYLAHKGHKVTVITSRLSYDDPTASLSPRETLSGVHIRRVWTTRFGRAGLWGRALDYASFYLSATLALMAEARRGDTILAKTDPPLISIPAVLVARLKRARLVNWCQDLFPETAAALGFRWAAGPVGQLLRRLRNGSLQTAMTNVVLCNEMRQHLLAESVPDERIRVIHNWCEASIRPATRNRKPGEPFTICYSGNLGRAHNVEAIIELIERTRHIGISETARGTKPTMDDARRLGQAEERGGGDVKASSRTSDDGYGRAGAASGVPATASVGLLWRFVGGGAGLSRLRAHVREHRITDVSFEGYAPRSHLAESLARADAHLVGLDPACEGLIHPSKIYGILAAGRPGVFIGSADGSMAAILARHDCGLTLDAIRPDTWRPAIEALISDARRLATMAQNAHAAHERHYSQAHALAAWREVLAPAAERLPATEPAPAKAAA